VTSPLKTWRKDRIREVRFGETSYGFSQKNQKKKNGRRKEKEKKLRGVGGQRLEEAPILTPEKGENGDSRNLN